MKKSVNFIERMYLAKGFIEYIHNAELMITTLKPLYSIPYTITINKTQRFVLLKPSKTIFGKPVWTLLNGYPLSITYNMIQTTNPILKPNDNQIKEKISFDTGIKYIENSNPNETYKKDINKEVDNLDMNILESVEFQNWITDYEKDGKKAMNNRTKQFTKGFSKFLEYKLEKNKDILFNYEKNDVSELVLQKLILPMFHTSQDFESFTQSGYNKVILKPPKFTLGNILLYLVSLALVGFMVFSFTNMYYQSI